jgi:hypothetical protein
MLECAGGSTLDGFAERSRPSFRNDNGGCSGCVRSANDGAEVVRIFNTVEDDDQSSVVEDAAQVDITTSSAECNHALMRNTFAPAIESFARFEANGHGLSTAEFDNLLNARSARAFRDRNSVERTPGAQGLAHGVNAERHNENATT